MSDFKEGSLSADLEAMLKKHGLIEVLTGLELACMDRANLIDDKRSRPVWRIAERKLQALSQWAQDQWTKGIEF